MLDRKLSGREIFLVLLVLALPVLAYDLLSSSRGKSHEEGERSLADQFEVTVWKDGAPPTPGAQPPFELIVNGTERLDDCFAAKSALVEVMKNAYEGEMRGKVSRVLLTVPGFLRASVGAADGQRTDWSPASAGPTATWDAIIRTKPYEDESGPLSSRTWGVALDGCAS